MTLCEVKPPEEVEGVSLVLVKSCNGILHGPVVLPDPEVRVRHYQGYVQFGHARMLGIAAVVARQPRMRNQYRTREN